MKYSSILAFELDYLKLNLGNFSFYLIKQNLKDAQLDYAKQQKRP